VRANSPYKKIVDLKGKKFGFVDPKSTSGYLYGRVLLRSGKLDAAPDLKNGLPFEFFGTHERALQALLEKKVEAVSVWALDPEQKQGAWTDGVFQSKAKQFRPIAFSAPIPNDAFVTTNAFWATKPDTVLRMMDAMIGLEDDPQKILMTVFNVERMVTATSAHYASVRALENILKGQAP